MDMSIPADIKSQILDIMDLPAHTATAPARIVVAMSGGVDSTVTAGLLKAAGFHVIGVTLSLRSSSESPCASRDIEDARAAAEWLGISHHVVDMRETFRRRIIEPFAETYARGQTPNPCVNCNPAIKFGALIAHARELGAHALVTGHYAEIRRLAPGAERFGLFTPNDMRRDQSYFLHAASQEQIDFLRFPLARLEKAKVRALAGEMGLERIAAKSDSQDICFVPPQGYIDIVRRLRPQAMRPGDLVHIDGRVLGRHQGIARYTIGQRRGLGVTIGEPLYVVEIDAANNRVIVGPKEALARRRLILRDINWLGEAPLPTAETEALPMHVRIRSTRPPKPARIWSPAPGEVRVRFDEPEYGVSPGQAGVFYERPGPGARVFGGGTIAEAAP